ncbi:hypothetical protein K2X33_13920 [bacterium]|nr:hypothetical protein [bacterium]
MRLILSALLLCFFSAESFARPRGGGGLFKRNTGGSYNTGNYVARSPKHETAIPIVNGAHGVGFYYQEALNRVQNDRVEIWLYVTNKTVLENKEAYFASVVYRDMRHSLHPTEVSLPLKWHDDNYAVITVKDLLPTTTYKFDVALWEEKKDADNTLAVTVERPFYTVTGGTTALDEARAKVMISALAELYLWDTGHPQRRARGYCGGGWCSAFAWWNIHRVGNGGMVQKNINDLIARSKAGVGLHGAYISWAGHYGLALAWDEDRRQLWTVEGNFNNRVMMLQRGSGGGFTELQHASLYVEAEYGNSRPPCGAAIFLSEQPQLLNHPGLPARFPGGTPNPDFIGRCSVKQLLIVFLIALVCSVLVASRTFSSQVHPAPARIAS